MTSSEGAPLMDAHLHALRASASRLAALVTPLDDAALGAASYATDWTISDVVSHLGSGAVIMHRRLEDGLAGTAMPDDFAPTVWAEWNSMPPRARVDECIASNIALLDRLDALGPDERSAFRSPMGPLEFDITAFVTMRVNEHALHTWDIAVALDPAATLLDDAAALTVDNLELIARFTAKPSGRQATIFVTTTAPDRAFTIGLEPDVVSFAPTTAAAQTTLTLPAESFTRLVYGRLDPDHTPEFAGDPAVLDELRGVFPGP
jgi:uncharacterized protein (TIGR03083 family)